MKRAVILYGTSSHSERNWEPWMSQQVETTGYEVRSPLLPEIVEALKQYSDW